jgi:hypothetical protein
MDRVTVLLLEYGLIADAQISPSIFLFPKTPNG